MQLLKEIAAIAQPNKGFKGYGNEICCAWSGPKGLLILNFQLKKGICCGMIERQLWGWGVTQDTFEATPKDLPTLVAEWLHTVGR